MCTVLLRFAPDEEWPILLGAVRDEFVERSWDPPARHWTGAASGLIGGRDHAAGGTWLAVDPQPERGGPALAALVNGPPLPPPAGGVRPTRGTLALMLLTTGIAPDRDALTNYDGFHLLRATPDRVEVWSWDGQALDHRQLSPGDHILVNHGLDTDADPLVPHFLPLLANTPSPVPEPGEPTAKAWGEWLDLMAGDGLDPADPRALIVRRDFGGQVYGSTSVCLVALSREGVRYDFSRDPRRPESWYEVDAAPTAPR